MGELEATMSHRELVEWRILYRLDPPLSERIDLIGGVIGSAVFNAARGRGVKARPPSDFMPLLEKPKAKPETPEQVGAGLLASIAETKKRVSRKKT